MPPTTAAAAEPVRRRRRGRRALFAIVAFGLGAVAVVALCEFLLRTFDPIGLNYEVEHLRYRQQALRFAWDGVPLARRGEIDLDGTLYRHKPNLDVDIGSYRLRTNSLGFRGPEIARQKPAGTFRILVLGDSVPYGVGVNDEVTFLRRWEGELNQRGPGRFEVVNTGHPMYDTNQELALFRDEGLALQPDLVLLIYIVNDIDPTRDVVEQALLGRPADPKEQLADPGDAWTRLAGVCRPLHLTAIAKLLDLQSDPAVRWLSTQPEGTEYVPELVGHGPRGWARSQKALLAIRDLCRGAKVPLFVLDDTIPALPSLPGFCREHDMPYFEFRFTKEELAGPIRNSMADSHPNAKGHDLMLQKLRAIEAQLPLPH